MMRVQCALVSEEITLFLDSDGLVSPFIPTSAEGFAEHADDSRIMDILQS